MPFATPSLTLRSVDANTWELVEPLGYRGRWQEFVVPAGFRTDLATVPRVVVWLIARTGRYTRAAVLHDWLVTEGIRSAAVTSREADGLFRRVMRELGVPVLRRWLMWTGVRWGALTDPLRRTGWGHSAPGVLAISLLAAPLVLPPALLIVPALAVYAVAERLVSLVVPAGAARPAGLHHAAGHD